ncbi:hypothetical protein ACWIGX_19330 [Streptomyces nigrescens]
MRTCARFGGRNGDGGDGGGAAVQGTRITMCLLAQRIEQLTGQIRDLEHRLARLVKCHSPPMGIGPDSAVTLLITMGDNPERLGSEASYGR